MRVPLGVIGIIYESRPNVTADAGALCLKAGNAAILRGGSESHHSALAIHACLVAGLRAAGLPEAAIQLVPTTDRAAVGHMLQGLDGAIDVIVPRGGKSLVARVQDEARVPVFAHLEGICHTYVDRDADLDMAVPDRAQRQDAPHRRLRRDRDACWSIAARPPTYLPPLVKALLDAGCEVRGDAATQKADARVKPATEDDWATEYLDAIIAVKIVDGVDERHRPHRAATARSTPTHHHRERRARPSASCATSTAPSCCDNASTQFADGGEFGFGAEIGIATGKLHARGPVGVEQLTSFKYVVRGTGQIRPK